MTSCNGTSLRRGIDRMWLTDIPEHPTRTGKLYICAMKDVRSNRIVGYSIGDRMTAQLAVSVLRSAVARRQPTRVVTIHSDRGGQGGFNWLSQHLDDGGADDGQTSRLDDGVDGPGADEVAGASRVAA